MDLSLKSLKRLESRINEELNKKIELIKKLNVFKYTEKVFNENANGFAVVDEFDDDWGAAFDHVETDINNRLKLLTIRSYIRREIGKINETCGINESISNRKLLLDKLNFINQVLSKADESNIDMNKHAIKANLISLRENPKLDTIYASTKDVNLLAMDINKYEELKTLKNSLTRELETVEDELSLLNSTQKVTLNKEDEEFLGRLKLL